MTSECAFSHSVREALLRDEHLVRLLGGTNVFEGYETKRATVRYDDATTTLQSIAQASTNAGYPASRAQ